MSQRQIQSGALEGYSGIETQWSSFNDIHV
jgi:hypothetical protein